MGDAEGAAPPGDPGPSSSGECVIYLPSEPASRLWQGEILQDLPQVRLAIGSIGVQEGIEVETDPHPLAIVLSQDCDLSQDFKVRAAGGAVLSDVLLCDVFFAGDLSIRKERGKCWVD